MFGSAAFLALIAAQAAAPLETTVEPAPRVRINPTKRVLRFVVPLTDSGNYLGDVDLAVDPSDVLSVKAERLLQMLEPILKTDIFARLTAAVAGSDEVSEAQLAAEQIALAYDNDNLALAISIPVSARRKSSLSLRGGNMLFAETLAPAAFSAFLNLRTAVDLVEHGPDRGIVPPVALIDGAARAFGVVGESEGYVSLRNADPLFRRSGSRLVYDDLVRVARVSLGDVRPVARTFQATATVAGLSIARFYNVLEPSREYRSSGTQSFSILGTSTVETIVNGRSVERRTLQPGSYTLSDFPLAEGSNDVRLLIEDETGKTRSVEFNLYSNRQLLEPAATEFSAFAGVYSQPGRSGIDYSREWTASGFVRRGMTQQLTAGVNLQADAQAQQAGVEALFGTGLGLVGIDLSASRRASGGGGYAAAANYEKIIGQGGETQHSIRAFVEHRSLRFAIPGALVAKEASALRSSFGYALTLGLDRFVSIDAQYARDRIEQRSRYSLRTSGGLRVSETLAAVAEVQWDHGAERNAVARLGLRKRFSDRSSARMDVDTKGEIRSSYQSSGGRGIGAWSGSVDLGRSSDGSEFNANGSLVTNRAELGFSQSAAYDSDSRHLSNVRTSLRAATSIAFADGAFAIGRPIQEAFVIAGPHRSLKGKAVYLDPQDNSENAASGALGPALDGSLSAYAPRLMIFEVPEAPPGYDLGAGNVQLVPPYKAGYYLKIGSDYHLLVIGRLLDHSGQPVSLLAGKAIDLKAPKRPAITMFTSRGGRFGAQGLRPGQWRIEMPTEGAATIYQVNITDDPSGTVRVGDLHPIESGEKK